MSRINTNLPLCPKCGDTKYVKLLPKTNVKPSYFHIHQILLCEKCSLEFEMVVNDIHNRIGTNR